MSNKSDFILTTKGTTAQRPNPAQTGMIRYNTTVPQYELYNGTAWVELGEQPPQFVSISPNTLASDATEAGSTQNLVISGGNFKSGATVSLVYSGGTVNAASVTVDSSSQITASFTTSTISSSHVTDANTYDVKIQNASGLSVSAADAVFVDSQPTWTLANSTTLRTVLAHARTGLSIPITTATDPDGDTVTYSATSLPTGLAISSSSGTITGNLANVTADTTNTFSVIANSTGSFSGAAQKSTTRSVNIVRKFGLSNSLLFDNSCLSKSFATSPTDSNEFTFSGWFKFDYSNQVDADYTVIFNAHEDQPYTAEIGSVGFRNTGSINFAQFDYTSGAPKGTINLNYSTNAAPFYRDPSAWYHFVWSYDYSGYVKIYVNGVEIHSAATAHASYTFFQTSRKHGIGGYWANSGSSAATLRNSYNGYMAELYGIDGQALTPTSFGETLNGVWIPKLYNPTGVALTDYGTNGFHLTFASSTLSGTTVSDVSGRGNHWTASGF